MKDYQLKVWPETRGYLPGLIPIIRDDSQFHDIFFDFTSCHSVNSSGLNTYLINVLKNLPGINHTRAWSTSLTSNPQITTLVKKIGFFSALSRHYRGGTLFADGDHYLSDTTHKISQDRGNYYFPLFELDFNSVNERRKLLPDFKKYLKQVIEIESLLPKSISIQLISILNEIAKNTADHTNSNLYFGGELKQDRNLNQVLLTFTIGDLGAGINSNVKTILPSSFKKRKHYWDLSQTYRFALASGNSTKHASTHNKGIGMSIILEGSKAIDLSLSVFDAHSRGLLTQINKLSHAEIRKCFISVGRDVGFFYYGKLIIKQ